MSATTTTNRTAPDREIAGLHGLMERYVDGDQRAFAHLHTALTPRIRGRLGRLVRDPTLVDDLVQLTFLRAHQARTRFSATEGRPDRAVEAWYLAIARNVALDHLRHDYRRERRHAAMEAKGDIAGMGAPAVTPTAEEVHIADEARAETVEQVRAAIDRLPPGQREVVKLHKLLGLSMAEIAGRLGVRQGALRVRAHRAYKALQGILGGAKTGHATNAA